MTENDLMGLKLGDCLHAARDTDVRYAAQTITIREGDAMDFQYWPDGCAFHTMAVRLRERDGNPLVHIAAAALRFPRVSATDQSERASDGR